MYKSLFAILMMSSIFSVKKGENKTPPLITPGTKDTVFLRREVHKGFYYAVYIEQNHESNPYRRVLDFKIKDYDSLNYAETYKLLKQAHPAPFKTYPWVKLPAEWLPLHRYKNKYYLYSPSDGGSVGRKLLTDSTIAYWDMDGPTPKAFLSAKKINNHTYNFKISSYSDNTKTAEVTIHIIDPVTNRAVWEYTSESIHYYELCIPKENTKNINMVVSYCETQRTGEFDFDKIDYKKLLQAQ